MDENTLTNIVAQLESARADLIQGLAKIDQALATVRTVAGADATPDIQDILADAFAGAGLDEDYPDLDADFADVRQGQVTFDVTETGEVVESEGAAEVFADVADALDEIRAIEDEEGEGIFGEYNGEDRIELTFVKVDDEGEATGVLTQDEVVSILKNKFTQTSLSNFGNLTLTNIRAGEVDASKVAVLRVVNEGRAPMEAIARNILQYRGTHPFPGIGIISVVGRAVFN